MILKEAIRNIDLTPPFDIEYRFTIPQEELFDELFGFARWTGEELVSLDGDSYDLDDEIINYAVVETTSGNKMLSVMFLTDTLTDADMEEYRQAWEEAHGIPLESETEEALFEYMNEEPVGVSEKTRAERRHMDIKKALRKRNISRKHYGWDYYSNLHQYSKNKIHCSCPMCTAKTNMKKRKGKGAVSEMAVKKITVDGEIQTTSRPSVNAHWGTTNERYGNRNYKISDRKKIESLKVKEQEYIVGMDDMDEE